MVCGLDSPLTGWVRCFVSPNPFASALSREGYLYPLEEVAVEVEMGVRGRAVQVVQLHVNAPTWCQWTECPLTFGHV